MSNLKFSLLKKLRLNFFELKITSFLAVICFNMSLGLDFLRSQLATHTVFREESDSEVKNKQMLEPEGNK